MRRRTLAGDHGRLGEDLAHRYLRRHGCTVVARNYRSPLREREKSTWWRGTAACWSSSKSRRARAPISASPIAPWTRRSSAAIAIAARDYGAPRAASREPTRFDIVSVLLGTASHQIIVAGAHGIKRPCHIIRCSANGLYPEGRSRLPELRKDPITGRWVIIATDRAKRPGDFIRQPVPPAQTDGLPVRFRP